MLGIFAKDPNGLAVKTRLGLQAPDAAHFYRACLADTIETACAVETAPFLFLALDSKSALDSALATLRAALLDLGLENSTWERLRFAPQQGCDLGERLEQAFAAMPTLPACVIGSDSPSLPPARLAGGLQALERLPEVDMILGPTTDGGYYLMGCRQFPPGLLRDVAWSSTRALADTRRRAEDHGLRVEVLEPWSDVDVPADLPVLCQQIAALRSEGDARTARHVEAVLAKLGGEP